MDDTVSKNLEIVKHTDYKARESTLMALVDVINKELQTCPSVQIDGLYKALDIIINLLNTWRETKQ